MKSIQKLLCVLLALTMVLSLGITAFAAVDPSLIDESLGSIEIDGVLAGNRYGIYKVLDLESFNPGDGTQEASYSYSIKRSSPFYDCIKDMTKDIVSVETTDPRADTRTFVPYFILTPKQGEEGTFYVSLNTTGLGGVPANNGAIVKEIAANVLKYISEYNADPNNTEKITPTVEINHLGLTDPAQTITPADALVDVEEVTLADPPENTTTKRFNLKFYNLDLGYYLIDTSAGTMLGLTTTDKNSTITAKNALPSLDKQVKKHGDGSWGDFNSKGVGETVEFRVAVTAQNGAKNYVVYDKMGVGLDFQKITKIYYGNENVASATIVYDATTDPVTDLGYATITTDGVTYNGKQMDFKVQLDDEFMQSVYDGAAVGGVSQVVYVEYEAIVTAECYEVDAMKNEAWLTYGDNNVEVGHETTTTHVVGFDLVKTNGTVNSLTNNYKMLAGAEFDLYELVPDTSAGAAPGATKYEQIPLFALPDETDANGHTIKVYRPATAEEQAVTGYTSPRIVAGFARVKGLGAGLDTEGRGRAYYLKEEVAPAGYNKLADPYTLVALTDNSLLNAVVNNANEYVSGGVQIKNNKGNQLPETGGIGTTIFYVVGSVLLVGAAVLLITKKRMSAEK